jgi:hypothetical protein
MDIQEGVQNIYCETPGNQPTGKPRRRWEDNIKIDPRDFYENGRWTEVAHLASCVVRKIRRVYWQLM